MVIMLQAFLDFCYIASHDVIDTKSLAEMDQALDQFHQYCTIFIKYGICDDFNIPWQHFLHHYPALVRAYGAPDGLCSSITESKHIKAVKKPWWCSSYYKALGQMLLTNQQLNKLTASHVDFAYRGMPVGTCLSYALHMFEGKLLPSCILLPTNYIYIYQQC